MQSLCNVNFDNYGYTMGSPNQDLIFNQRSIGNVSSMGDQGLSPPYSNQSPPHSVQSNIALSPQGYIGKFHLINLIRSPLPHSSRARLTNNNVTIHLFFTNNFRLTVTYEK